jgi:hypothetical protein
MLSFTVFDDGRASIMSENGEWWCGSHEWVEPGSSWWELCSDCWNVKFPNLNAAVKFARAKGWVAKN